MEAQLVGGATLMQLSHIEGLPALIGIFLQEISRALRGDLGQPAAQGRLGQGQGRGAFFAAEQAGEAGGGLLKRLGGAGVPLALAEQFTQVLEGAGTQPAGKGVVRAVKNAARVQRRGGQLQQRLLDRCGDPGGDAMGDDVVMGRRQGSGIGCEAEEVGLLELDVAQAQLLGQPAAVDDVIGLEVDAGKAAFGVGGGEQAEAQAHAAAQLQIGKGLTFMGARWLMALEQGGEIQPGRRQLAIDPRGVRRRTEVAVIPGHEA